ANYSLDLDDVFAIRMVLQEIHALAKWGKHEQMEDSDLYTQYIARINPGILKLKLDLDRIFYPDGNVREDASPELARLNKRLAGQEKNINAAFQQVVQKYKSRDLLTEPYESYKNGKLVLCVAAANKRNIKG